MAAFTPIDVRFAPGTALPPAGLAWRPQVPAECSVGEAGLTVRPGGKTDYWRRTHYGFDVVNAPALTTQVTGDFVAQTRVTINAVHQYDQAGLVCWFDEDCWLKTSCEFIPTGPSKLGAVVTNGGWSDWSTQPAPAGAPLTFEFRLARLGSAYFVHVRSSPESPWFLARLAHLAPDAAAVPCHVGLYACSPLGDGGTATFEYLEVRRPREGEVALH